ncbi:chemotaxis protein CheW [Chromatium okenii]|uniref:chemotaxis protein CheW n=1 Tax=Chromatium okenii TaxID=61644 RepID=UPI001903CFE2|nr:chemotaxis protein CheW [Chromatium okenii]MBK1641905.1 chemotaxis protein CheW [Chromatium okenii]
MGQLVVSKQAARSGRDLNDEVTQYLTFSVADERLAMSITAVKEIIETPQVTRVPMTPDYIRGVINLRGNVVPVVDLGARLGRGALTLTKRSCIVLVEVQVGEEDRHVLGMLVDEVKNILDIPPQDVKPPPEFGSEIRTDFIEAMGRVEDIFVIILSVDHVLSVQELASLRHFTDDHVADVEH